MKKKVEWDKVRNDVIKDALDHEPPAEQLNRKRVGWYEHNVRMNDETHKKGYWR